MYSDVTLLIRCQEENNQDGAAFLYQSRGRYDRRYDPHGALCWRRVMIDSIHYFVCVCACVVDSSICRRQPIELLVRASRYYRVIKYIILPRNPENLIYTRNTLIDAVHKHVIYPVTVEPALTITCLKPPLKMVSPVHCQNLSTVIKHDFKDQLYIKPSRFCYIRNMSSKSY